MTDLNQQKNLTGGKGWGQVWTDYKKAKTAQIKTKVTNIVSGIKATPKFIKKSFKKD
jgi:hypothetical protein